MKPKLPAFLALLSINAILMIATTVNPSWYQYLALASTDSPALTLIHLITYQFTHAGFWHYFGNFLFAAPFAIYLEKEWGALKFLLIYLLCGIGSAVFFMNMTPGTYSLVGASGAISGLAAIALCKYGKKTLLLKTFCLAALIGFFMPQLQAAITNMIMPFSNVAFWGHIGGVLTGLLYLAQE